MSCKCILAILVSVSLLQIAVFSESTEKPGAESTEKPVAESTENPGAESTEKPGAESTENPGAESTEKPGAESTENPGAESTEKPGAIEKTVSGTINMLNQTNAKLRTGFKSVVDIAFMPLEIIGTKAEEGIIGGTRIIGKTIGFVANKVKGAAIMFQTKEEKFISCVKSEQFDPVKKIFLDISSCVTSKAGTVSNIVEKGLVQVNTTFSIVKSLTALPTCQGAKCLADYSSGIVGKIGQIGLGMASIGLDATTGLATIPITLPTCLLTQPALSPVKVFGLLGINIAKCLAA